MAVRLKDIAQDLGVSVVTVSKVLRNHSDIGEETRQRVLKRVKELNYQPNIAARTLVTGKTYMVGLIVPDLVHPFFSELAKGLSAVLRKRNYGLIISSSEEDPELERAEIEQLLARRVDALVVASAQWTVESFRRIEAADTPYVLVDRSFAGLAANFVGVDDELVGRIATEHLVANGYRRIAHIGGRYVSTALGRLEGYRRTLARHKIVAPPEYVLTLARRDESGDETGFDSMKKLLKLTPRPDAVFCYNDPTAMGAMKAILAAGLRIPEDVAVVGAGNVRYAEYLRVPLTSVSQDTVQMGEKAAKLALSLIASKTVLEPRTVLLEPALVERASSARRVKV